MAGFRVASGSYQNTRAPNPNCCSDPTVLCPKCAKIVLNGSIEDYYDPAEALAQVTGNCANDDDDDVTANEDRDNLPLPATMEQVANARRKEMAAKPTAHGRKTRRPADDNDTLPLPVYNWSGMSGIGRN